MIVLWRAVSKIECPYDLDEKSSIKRNNNSVLQFANSSLSNCLKDGNDVLEQLSMKEVIKKNPI
jgi:hypothetical protein